MYINIFLCIYIFYVERAHNKTALPLYSNDMRCLIKVIMLYKRVAIGRQNIA